MACSCRRCTMEPEALAILNEDGLDGELETVRDILADYGLGCAAQSVAEALTRIRSARAALATLSPPLPSLEVERLREALEAVPSFLRHADEPLDAMADCLVAGIEAWKINDEEEMDRAMKACLDRIAAAVERVSEAALSALPLLEDRHE